MNHFIRKFSSTVGAEENLHLSTQALQTLKKRALSSLPKYRRSNLAFILVVLIGERHQKKLYVPLTNSKNSSEVLLATLELELSHLQWNAYGAAATRACKTLREPPYRVVVDHNKTIIRWFNESRQAGRLVELMWNPP